MSKATKEKTIRLLLHILVLAVLIMLPVFSARRFRMGSNFLLTFYTFAAISALIFYINYLFLVPRLFFRKKRFSYYLALPFLIVFLWLIYDFASEKVYNYIRDNGNQEQLREEYPQQAVRTPGEGRMPRPPLGPIRRPWIVIAIPNARAIGYFSSSLLMIFLSLGLRVLERQSKMEKMHEELERTRLNTELAFLKNQISPHFFFNTLNNIYSLIGRNNDDSKNAVIRLSKLMRYVINESAQDLKPLSEEIDFMRNYIDLMQLRIGSKTRLNIDFPSDCNELFIPQLLFISLIENAFKYGISVQEESFVNIRLTCGENNILFICENGLPAGNNTNEQASSGIGIENLRKRLNLLYPGKHDLEIGRTAEKFEVKLNIRL